jgi:hypothetical protein
MIHGFAASFGRGAQFFSSHLLVPFLVSTLRPDGKHALRASEAYCV